MKSREQTMQTQYLKCLVQSVTPETTIIVFDLHNVVFKRQTAKIVARCLKLLPRGTWRYTFNPVVWYRVYRLHTHSHVAEDIFRKVAVYYPDLTRFRNDFIRITNTQRPIRKVVELIKDLKLRGYRLYILSNIGKDTFNELSALYPEISGYFDGAFTACAENNYLHKPQQDFYEQFKEYVKLEGQGDKQILFIDDLKKNLAAAVKSNIAGLQYKSSRQLKTSLKNLDVL